MSTLTIRNAAGDGTSETLTDSDAITARLAAAGVEFERWELDHAPPPDADEAAILGAYRESIARLNARYGFRSIDVVSVGPDHPQAAALRGKFLAEHTHADFEVRFFVAGRGLFYLHVGELVYMLLCERGDLISVPADTTHWFDMGTSPSFTCIRFFTAPDGWVGKFTGSDIATRFPDFDTYVAGLA